jgi:hypothetical protein
MNHQLPEPMRPMPFLAMSIFFLIVIMLKQSLFNSCFPMIMMIMLGLGCFFFLSKPHALINRFREQHQRHTNPSYNKQPLLVISLLNTKFISPQHLSLLRVAHSCVYIQNAGGCGTISPIRRPFDHNRHSHIPKSTHKEHKLRQKLEQKIHRCIELNCIECFHANT